MIRSCSSSILNRLILSRFNLSWPSKATSDPSAYTTSNTSSYAASNTASYTASYAATNGRLCSLLDHHRLGGCRPQVKSLHFNLLRAQINLILLITVIVNFSKILETTADCGTCSLSISWTGSLFVTHASTSAKLILLACHILSTVLLIH